MLKILKENMRKVFLAIAILVVSGVFTSCTDLEEKIVPELQNTTGTEDSGDTGGEEDQDPPKDPDGN